MNRTLIAVLILLALAGAAHAISFGREGVVFGKLGAAGKGGTAPAPPSSCDGSIDLSTGCVMPMLR